MSGQSTRAAALRQALSVDQDLAVRSVAVDRYFAMLRKCIADCGWSIEALAVEMRIDKGYLWKLLHREKPGWKPEHEIALPDDVEALLRQRQAEAFGRIVVEAVDGEQAVRNLVSGLFGVLAPRLPARATKMAPMAMPEDAS